MVQRDKNTALEIAKRRGWRRRPNETYFTSYTRWKLVSNQLEAFKDYLSARVVSSIL